MAGQGMAGQGMAGQAGLAWQAEQAGGQMLLWLEFRVYLGVSTAGGAELWLRLWRLPRAHCCGNIYIYMC